jgi:hypothetical protein
MFMLQVICKYSNREIYAHRLGKFSIFAYIIAFISFHVVFLDSFNILWGIAT